MGLFNADGVCCYGTNTEVEQLFAESLTGEGHVDLVIDSLDLVEGTYKLDAAVHKRDGYPYDYHRLLYTFRVKSRTKRRRHLPSAASLVVRSEREAEIERRVGVKHARNA